MQSLTPPLPEYRSIKTVWALKIKQIHPDEWGIGLVFEEAGFDVKAIPNGQLMNRPKPEAGWYYVQYEGGYFSFSPADQFEKGNIPIEKVIENAARLAHEANRLLCQSLGDFSQPEWDVAPKWQKESAIVGVRQILNDPSTTSEQSHQSWLRQKRDEGWKYGEVKNPETKEHPCFVPYHDLPVAQRLKDHLFGLTVRSVLFPQ